MEIRFFRDINLQDPFFDSLKAGYKEFEDWYNGKKDKGERALVHYDDANQVEGFLYLKIEEDELDDIEPKRAAARRLKVGTFKINPHGTKLGERFIKKLVDKAIHDEVEEIYVTVFEEHGGLINLLKKYGFVEGATKTTENGTELVLFKDMTTLIGDIFIDYPLVDSINKRKFGLSIYPTFHSEMFPDSILNNESYDLITDVSHTNSIHKIYICYMRGVNQLQKGDLLCIYRTKDNLGPAYYRSVITSICVVEEVKVKGDFINYQEYLDYVKPHSIFDAATLKKAWNNDNVVVIKMTYNIALKKRITNKILIEELGMNPAQYWGFFPITDKQFNQILEIGEVYENIIVN